MADSYHNLGNTYYQIGEWEKALLYHNQAMKIRQENFGQQHGDVAISYYSLGNVFLEKNNLEEALHHHHQALQIRKAVFGEIHFLVAKSYDALGNVQRKRGDFVGALDMYQKALAVRRSFFSKDNTEMAGSFISIGHVILEQGDADAALNLLQKALPSLVPAFKDSSLLANPKLSQIRAEPDLLRALEIKARALKRLSLQKQNVDYLKSSLKTSELCGELAAILLREYSGDESKYLLNQRRSRSLAEALNSALLLQNTLKNGSYSHEAYHIASSSKAHVLSLTITASRAKQYVNIPDSLLQEEHELQIDLAFHKTAIQKQRIKQNPDSLQLAASDDRYFALRRKQDDLENYIRINFPRYHELKYKGNTPSVSEIQKYLSSYTALVEYFFGDSALHIFTITQKDFQITSAQVDSSFRAAINGYANSFKSVSGTAKEAYLQNAVRLYQKLVQPVERYIAGKPQWLIIPHNELFQVPFEALLTTNQIPPRETDYDALPYLLKQREISYHYSAALFLKQQEQRNAQLAANRKARAAPKASSEAHGFLGFAPVFSAGKQNGRILRTEDEVFRAAFRGDSTLLDTERGLRLQELPHSERELEAIIKMFEQKKTPGLGYFHQQAAEEKFKSAAGNFKYLHVATHGLFNAKYPNLSGLFFSQPDSASREDDGVLYAAEIFNLNLSAELVVLSSCESAAGQLQKGEGLMALTRPFLYAGAANLVAALWKVYDRHTSEMMVSFYECVLQGKHYSQALREAKLKMIANPASAGPKSWAAFVLIGR